MRGIGKTGIVRSGVMQSADAFLATTERQFAARAVMNDDTRQYVRGLRDCIAGSLNETGIWGRRGMRLGRLDGRLCLSKINVRAYVRVLFVACILIHE
jgi:hypothetical protein